MRITRTPVRKSPPLPSPLADIVEHLINDDQDQIKVYANHLDSWTYPRGDLFQFVSVLNRFDGILERICEEYQLKSIQRIPFDSETKLLLLTILRFSKILFENCTNRNLYNSYEHLNALLNTTDIDVLEAVLRLMLKPAQRVNNPKAVQSSFLTHQDKITELARGGSISDLISLEKANDEISMSFYKEEGLQVIQLHTTPLEKTDSELFWQLVEEYQIADDYHFELLNRIRIANHPTQLSVRKQLLVIRFIALVIMAHTMSETIAQNRVFIYEPHLVPQIAQLVSYDTSVPVDIQTYALYALDGIARHRTKVTEVLSAFNASANHGILLHILRQLCQPDSVYTVDFLDALFTLLSFLLQTTAGSTMLMTAGIMSTLIEVLNYPTNTNSIYRKALIKVVGLLDTIMNNVQTSFSSFCSAKGLEALLQMMQTQVDASVAIEASPDALTLIKNALRFLIRMMESSDTADGLRNLVESSIPHTMKKVMQHHSVFGPSVFSLVVHVTTTFIHYEPTSLSILQELGLPQAFLTTFLEYKEPNFEVLMCSVHAFGALCLNSAGLDMFNQYNPLPHFFKLMTHPSFVSNSFEVGSVTALGTAMDELIRHHPSLKMDVFKCADQLLQQVIKVGHAEDGKPKDNSHVLVTEAMASNTVDETECLVLGFVELVARFLEGFLSNSENIKEFVKYGGPELLLTYYALPMLPYDFSIASAFDSLGYVFRIITDVSPLHVAALVSKKVHEASRFIFTDLDMKKSVIHAMIQQAGTTEGNELFRKLSILFGYIGMLSTVFASAILTNARHSVKVVEWCIQEKEYGDMILLLGDIHRTMVWQNILLRDSVPKAWYNNKPSKEEDTVDSKDPQVMNVRRFKLLLSEIPPALMPIFQGLIKVSVNRRHVPSAKLSLRTRARLVAQGIACIFKKNLEYMEQDAPICKYDYYASMFSMISMLMLDDRSRMALETPIAFAFQEQGNVDLLLDRFLPQFWKDAETHLTSPDDPLLQRINTCIELLLAILNHLGCSKLFHNSPHTQLLTQRGSDEDEEDTRTLNPYYWMTFMRLRLSCLFDYLSSPLLQKQSRHVLHSLLRCMTQNLKQEGERPIKNTPKHSEHQAENREALVSMGFGPDLVDHALRMFPYGLCALDYLFSRHLVQRTAQSGPPQLEISPLLRMSQPLSTAEFDAGIRILVNLWYNPDLATVSLNEHDDVVQAIASLSALGPSAIQPPSMSNEVTQIQTNEIVEDDHDDEYEDIDTEEEEEEEDTEFNGYYGHFSSKDGSKQAQEIHDELAQKRKCIREEMPQVLARLVDERSDIDLEIRDLMAVSCYGDPDHVTENTTQTIRLFFGDTLEKSNDKRAVFESSINKIRIFALMLREPAMQDVLSLLITIMADYMDWFEFLELIVNHPKFPDPKWLTTLFLILEVGLAQSDEPKDDQDQMDAPSIVTPDNRTTLLKYCIDLLKLDTLSQDNLIATLRIMVRLTKHHEAALQLVEFGGLLPLFKRPRTSFESFKVQQTYIIMILRHIIESKSVLKSCMREWFDFWVTVPNARFLDVATFISNNHSLALRDASVFLDVSSQLYNMCDPKHVSTKDPKRLCYIAMSSSPNIEQDTDSAEPTAYSSTVVHFLLNELVQTQASEEASDIHMAYTGFLLQCLFELVSSYPSCKLDMMNFNMPVSQDTTHSHHRMRNSILYKLVNQLLPYNAIHASTDQERKKQGVSMWVASLLVGLCYSATQSDHHATALNHIRKHVLDVVACSFKDALQSTTSMSTKYNGYFALTELCHRLLNARPSSIHPNVSVKENALIAMAQCMLEKGFVGILISVIHDVDVNYPHAKLILNSILRPLEQLTKLAMKSDLSNVEEKSTLDAASEAMAGAQRVMDPPGEEQDEEDIYIPMDTDDDNEAEEEEMNDLYRNSSLAMFDGTALEESSEEESDEEDIEMASSGEEIVEDSSDSDMEYETVSGSEEEEEEEDQEMEDLMRSHRYHHSDTEDDEETGSSEDDSESDSGSESEGSYSSSEYESSNESLNSDRSDSIHSEASRDIGWHLEEDQRAEGRHRRRTERITIEQVDDDHDTMDIDFSDLEDQDSDELNQEELEDVERNLELFHNQSQRDGNQLMNSTIRGSLNNTGNNTNRSFDRDNVILHPLLRNANTSNVDIIATTNPSSITPETALLSGANSHHLQAYEDIIGGSAVRILEDLLSQQRNQQQQDESQQQGSDKDNKETLSILKDFQPLQTTDRWSQEVQMVYISSVASVKAAKLKNALIDLLTKKALQQEPESSQQEEPKEEEPKEEEPKEEEPKEEEPKEEEPKEEEPKEEEPTEEEPKEEETILTDQVPIEDRVTVMINGEQVDITDTGIDVEFLEALPDDLRAEVYSQQMAERRASVQSMEEDEISPEFLDALPSDIRQELLESASRYRRHQSPPATSQMTPFDIAANLNDQEGVQVHPNLGMATLSLAGGPNPLQNNNTTWRIGGGVTRNTNGQRNEFTAAAPKPEQTERKAVIHRNAPQLLDRTQLASLTRLLFVPQSISKTLLNRLLLNLCENSKTRNDLLALLICILQDGSTDLAAVDRILMQMSLQKSSSRRTEEPKKTTVVESVPNLITQRCLEILYYVISWNDRSLAYFLTENDHWSPMKRRHSIGGSSKSSKSKATLPILVLVGLLDRPVFLDNTTLMEQLMNLLAAMCRPISSIVKKYKEKKDNTGDKKHHHAHKPPCIPEEYLEKVVHVLSIGECSSHTFQYTLSVLSHVSHLDGALDIIIERLQRIANASGKQIITDLEQLQSILSQLKAGAELEGSALTQFSATTSHQAKLLRVLKAMDYLYTRKRNNAQKAEENEKAVVELYAKLDFSPLWNKLGVCMTLIQDREDLVNVASVFLPLVESFMAVSKYSALKSHHHPKALEPGSAEEFFYAFTEEHKKILNIMVRNNPSLMSGSFSLLVYNPKILEFDNKRKYFNQQLHKRTEPREHYPPLRFSVRRAHVFEDTYQKLQGLTGNEIKHGKLNVEFEDEEGVDAGGVAREWFSVLARQMFDPNYALFITSAADKLTYQPNRASGVNSEHLSYFKFVGRIIGKAIHDGRLLDAYFTRSFYKLMLGRSVDYRDVEAVDPAYYKSLVWILENDITDIIDLTFSVETDDFGTNKVIDLKPNGRDIPVTEANKHEYVSLITEHKLVLAIKDQVNAFLEGFHDIIPSHLIQIFNEQELELLISGLPDIDIDEWKANTVYEGYSINSPQIQWFWRAVRSFDQEERAKLLQFSTGTSKVPLEGFAQLQGSNGVQKFQIHKEFGDVNRLPSAHTCFNQIDLPAYQSYEDLRSSLFKAISECSTGFAFQ